MMQLQARMPTAAYGLSPVVPTHLVDPMELLALSGSSVIVAAARKAVRTWVVWRPFGGDDGGRFAALMGTVGSGGQIWHSHCHYCAHMGVTGEGAQVFWL